MNLLLALFIQPCALGIGVDIFKKLAICEALFFLTSIENKIFALPFLITLDLRGFDRLSASYSPIST